MSEKVLIAMSGGVDSSAAALIMKDRGYDCIGVTMRLYVNEQTGVSAGHTCCSLDDIEDARSVAADLDIPYYVFNFTGDFQQHVMDRFVRAYEEGATPNPCIDCNRYLKFSALYDRAKQLGCEKIVTGHYARIEYREETGRYVLKKAVNSAKDQSYVLCFMTQDQLAHTAFPLGEIADKDEVRLLAREQGLINAGKHDSQDICFVPDGDYAAFIERYTGRTYPEGEFVDEEGQVLGKHRGIIRYTVGQRKGLGLALPAPLYVKEKDMDGNRVILTDNEGLFTTYLRAGEVNWISTAEPAPGTKLRVSAKPRYRAKEAPAEITVLEDGSFELVFDEPQRALTVGQAVVCYDGEDVVAGGIIYATKQ